LEGEKSENDGSGETHGEMVEATKFGIKKESFSRGSAKM
jgi:hypothetical protein